MWQLNSAFDELAVFLSWCFFTFSFIVWVDSCKRVICQIYSTSAVVTLCTQLMKLGDRKCSSPYKNSVRLSKKQSVSSYWTCMGSFSQDKRETRISHHCWLKSDLTKAEMFIYCVITISSYYVSSHSLASFLTLWCIVWCFPGSNSNRWPKKHIFTSSN